MRRLLPAAALLGLLGLFGARSLAAMPAASRDDEEEEHSRNAVRFVAPAPEMRKLAALSGTWTFDETWTEPTRYKRGSYEGEPGPGGHGTLKIRPGPGGFSVLADYDAQNPMGRVTALVILAWSPPRKVYDYEEIHSAFPGVLRLTGRFEGGDLVFRGKDAREGRARTLRVVWKGLGQDAWSMEWSEAEARGRFKKIVTVQLRRAPAP
ncbi:MAG TPA: hypothetical protein VMN82_15555 [Thermoanaerobaculia bacterium]|nr:hypothetical protein [Thermoanaerobaculia bacterium]